MDGESTDELWTEAVVVVADDKFIQVLAEEFKDYAYMFTKNDKVLDFDDIRGMI